MAVESIRKPKLNILIIDDDRVMRKFIRAVIIESSHNALSAANHTEALSLLSFHKIDLILMDIEMPEVDGFNLTKIVREQLDRWVPIIFLSANKSDEYLAKGIDAGGDDYLTKPINQVILNAKIRAMSRIAEMQMQLDELNKKLEKLSNIDSLTQLLNRRGLVERLEIDWASNKRRGEELSIMLLDIDFFKSYNDNYGHPQGDLCLQQFSQVLSTCMHRTVDTIARYGGEEFLIILPATPIDGARFKAEKIIKALLDESILHEHSSVAKHVTASIGISSTAIGACDYSELIEQADVALYQAKNQGRNRCVIYQAKALGKVDSF